MTLEAEEKKDFALLTAGNALRAKVIEKNDLLEGLNEKISLLGQKTD